MNNNINDLQQTSIVLIVFCLIFAFLLLRSYYTQDKLKKKLKETEEGLDRHYKRADKNFNNMYTYKNERDIYRSDNIKLRDKLNWYRHLTGVTPNYIHDNEDGGTTSSGISKEQRNKFFDQSLGEPLENIPEKWSLSREVWKQHEEELKHNTELLNECMRKVVDDGWKQLQECVINDLQNNVAKSIIIPNTKHTSTCLQKAKDDEPIFVLRANDPTAPSVVGAWIGKNYNIQSKEKIDDARNVIKQMRAWRKMQITPSDIPIIKMYDGYTGKFLTVVECLMCGHKYVPQVGGKCPSCKLTN